MGLVFFALVATISALRYDGDQLHVVHIANESSFLLFSEAVETLGLDPWHNAMMGHLDVRVPKHAVAAFNRLSLESTLAHDDVQALIDAEKGKRGPGESYFSDYHDYEEVNTYMFNLCVDHPSICEVARLGRTYEGREIFGYRISGDIQNKEALAAKPGILYNGGQHAREWIPIAVVQYIATELMTKYTTNSTIQALVDGVDWHIVPVVNVDGYHYTHTDVRLWRKTRNANAGSTCIGTDPNRNWDMEWSGPGSSSNPCSDTYHGASPFSCPETTALAQYMRDHPNLKLYVDWHNQGQMMMCPWGYTCQLPPQESYEAQVALGQAAMAALENVHGRRFVVGSVCNIIYQASGGSQDWAYDVGIPYSYCIELRGPRPLPAEQIIPSGEESSEAAWSMGHTILAEFS